MTPNTIVATHQDAVIQLSRRKDGVLSLRYPGGHEVVSAVEEVQHPIVRQALQRCGLNTGFDLLVNFNPAHLEDFSEKLNRVLGQS